MSCLLCFTCDGGVPLFTRSIDFSYELPFAVSSVLNGIRTFAENHDCAIIDSENEKVAIYWKVIERSLALILLRDKHSEGYSSTSEMQSTLQLVSDIMVLFYGFDEISNIRNVDRFRREIRVAFKLIDYVLKPNKVGHHPLKLVESCIAQNQSQIDSTLQQFCTTISSPYALLLVRGKVLAATENFYSLEPIEQILVIWLVNALRLSTSSDMPVFLPKCSPNVPHRLLTIRLNTNTQLCAICGSEPSFTESCQQAVKFWANVPLFVSSYDFIPSSVLSGLDRNILAVLIVNTTQERCLYFAAPRKNHQSQHRRPALENFYLSMIRQWEDEPKNDKTPSQVFRRTESFVFSMIAADDVKLFLCFGPEMPVYALGATSMKCLNLLQNSKVFSVVLQ